MFNRIRLLLVCVAILVVSGSPTSAGTGTVDFVSFCGTAVTFQATLTGTFDDHCGSDLFEVMVSVSTWPILVANVWYIPVGETQTVTFEYDLSEISYVDPLSVIEVWFADMRVHSHGCDIGWSVTSTEEWTTLYRGTPACVPLPHSNPGWEPSVQGYTDLGDVTGSDDPALSGGVLHQFDQGGGVSEWGYWTAEHGYVILGWTWVSEDGTLQYVVAEDGPLTVEQLHQVVEASR